MAAEVLIKAGFKVDLYEAMPSVGRKFLMAGKGGMNISNDEPSEVFIAKFGNRINRMKEVIKKFSSVELKQWLLELGIDTFVGSSGRIFPSDMKAAPLLRKWLQTLRFAGVGFHMRHQWLGWNEGNDYELLFNVSGKRITVNVDAVILALGGASWPQLGSTGDWVSILEKKNVSIAPLRPSNCGFDAAWSDGFSARYVGLPLKSVCISFRSVDGVDFCNKGELIITEYGIEGGVIYTLSASIRDEIAVNGYATIYLDLLPNVNKETVIIKLNKGRGKQSMANHLRKQLGIDGLKAGLLREMGHKTCFSDAEHLSVLIKSLPIKLIAARPISEAISSAGGVDFSGLDDNLMIINKPGIFCTGEMLDWEAPTGGYLITACLALGQAVGMGLIASFKLCL